MPDEAAGGGAEPAVVLTSGAAGRMGASAELPASLRGGLGFTTAVGGLGAGGEPAGALGGAPAVGADFKETASTFGALAAALVAGGLATAGERAASRLS